VDSIRGVAVTPVLTSAIGNTPTLLLIAVAGVLAGVVDIPVLLVVLVALFNACTEFVESLIVVIICPVCAVPDNCAEVVGTLLTDPKVNELRVVS
jgi:hypothetical protein